MPSRMDEGFLQRDSACGKHCEAVDKLAIAVSEKSSCTSSNTQSFSSSSCAASCAMLDGGVFGSATLTESEHPQSSSSSSWLWLPQLVCDDEHTIVELSSADVMLSFVIDSDSSSA